MRRWLICALLTVLGLQASDIRSDEVRGAHFLTTLGAVPYTTAITGVVNQSKLVCTGGNPGTCTLYDDTLVTGITYLWIRAGAGQGVTPLVYFSSSAGAALGGINASNTLHALGGWTATEVAIKRSGTDLQVRLADDSLYSYADALGYKVGGAGTLGRYLRGNGTAFVISTGAASGTGACGAGNFVTATNDDAVPACAAPSASGYVLGGAGLTNVNRLTKVTAAGTIGEAAVVENGTSIYDTAARNWGLGTWARTGNTTPGQRLDVFGGNVEVADPSSLAAESLQSGTFANCAVWGTTGDFTCAAGVATYLHNTGVGTLTQTVANQATAAVGSRWYKFVYTLSGVTAGATCQITTAYALTAQTLDLTAGVAKEHYFKSAVAPTNFVISCTSTGGGFTLDDVSLKQITGGNVTLYGKILGGGTSGVYVNQAGNFFADGLVRALSTVSGLYFSDVTSDGFLIDPYIADALTVTSAYHLFTRHGSSGTPAAGFGSAWGADLETSTNAAYERAGELHVVWTDATAGSADSKWNFYSSVNSVLTLALSVGNNGFVQFAGATAAFPALRRVGNAIAFRQADGTLGNFAALTACAAALEGAVVVVTDSSTNVWGAIIAGAGANRVLAYCNGTNWTVAAR